MQINPNDGPELIEKEIMAERKKACRDKSKNGFHEIMNSYIRFI